MQDIESALAALTAAGYSIQPPEPKRRIVRITIDVPEPMTQAPEVGDTFWYPQMGWDELDCDEWTDTGGDGPRLAAGLCYASQADAQAFLDAWARRSVVPVGDV